MFYYLYYYYTLVVFTDSYSNPYCIKMLFPNLFTSNIIVYEDTCIFTCIFFLEQNSELRSPMSCCDETL